jgi:hypothetical protein
MPYTQVNPYGVKDIHFKRITGGTDTDLKNARRFNFSANISTDKLKGDDGLAAVASTVESFTLTIEGGGMDLGALAEITGKTLVSSGTTPNQLATYTFTSSDVMPYLKVAAQTKGVAGDDIHVIFYYAKITALTGNIGNSEFTITNMTLEAIGQPSDGKIYDVIAHETATTLTAL